MPVTKSAIKKLRQDRKRTIRNNKTRLALKTVVKAIRKSKKASLDEAFSNIDKAKKRGLIHANKAARLKSQLSKIAPKKASTKASSKTAIKTKPASKKSVSKKTKKTLK